LKGDNLAIHRKISNPSREASWLIDYLFSLFSVLHLPSRILIASAAGPVIIAGLFIRLRRFAFLVLIRWPPPQRFRLILPVAVILTLLLKPLWVFCFGI
jgi:hypothetical protein